MSDPFRPWWERHPARAAALLAFIVYLPSLGGGFLYDDYRVVLENPSIFDLRNLRWVLSYEKTRPLLNLTWALNYAAAGYTAWTYHLVNIVLHAANAALVAVLFGWVARDRDRRQAFAAAALFAVTPMAAETAAYVASRSTALASFFTLLTLILAVKGLEQRSWRWTGAAVATNLVALACKEEAASIPLYLFLLDRFFLRSAESPVKDRWRQHAPFWILPLAMLAAHRVLTGAWLPEPAIEPARYLVTQVALFPRYLARAVAAVDPAFFRGTLPASWPPDATTILMAGIAIGVCVVAFRSRERWPEVCFAVCWLAAGLLPSSSFVALQEMEVDHRAYLGGAGVLFALAGIALRAGVGQRLVPIAGGLVLIAVGYQWVDADRTWSWSAALIALVALAGLACRGQWMMPWALGLAVVAVHYEWILMNPMRAWSDAVRRAPHSAEASLGLGQVQFELGDSHDAERELQRALSLNPSDARAWANLGVIWLAAGRRAEAVEAFRQAAELAPRDARIRDNLAMTLQAMGDTDGAVREFEAALLGEPRLAQPRIALASILIDRRDFARARRLIEEVRQMARDKQDEVYLDQTLAKLYEHDQ